MPIDRRSLLNMSQHCRWWVRRRALGTPPVIRRWQKADYTLRIAPVSLELATGKTITTTGYNGKVPGPVLRLREGSPVIINVINDAGYPDIVHWHGLYLPAVQDGATEEGSLANGQARDLSGAVLS